MSKARQNLREYKLCVVGGGAVGKSCLTLRFIRGQFVDDWLATIEDQYSKVCRIDDEDIQLSVLDTAGQDDYSALRPHYMRHGEGFLLVYSIANEASFRELDVFIEDILRVKDRDRFPMIVVGQKCDLEYQRQVPTSAGRALAARLDCAFIETSAKTRHNVDQAFIGLIHEIKRYQRDTFGGRQVPQETMQVKEPKPSGGLCGSGCIIA